jgi:hypothetical protein
VYNTQSVLRGRDRLIVGLTASYGTIKVVKNVREYRRGNHELTIQSSLGGGLRKFVSSLLFMSTDE